MCRACVDDELIFFGPCKVRMREELRRYLSEATTFCRVTDDIHIVGVNGGNKDRVRKIVWAGKVSEVMTFAEAHRRLTESRFDVLRHLVYSPLHVRPILAGGELKGYTHCSEEHRENDGWVADLTSGRSRVNVTGRFLTIPLGSTAWDALNRDCCSLLESHFYARGAGLPLDPTAIQILKDAQPGTLGIDDYAVFGVTKSGSANGLRGTSCVSKTHWPLDSSPGLRRAPRD